MLETRVVTHPVNPTGWVLQVLLYEDRWSTIMEGSVYDCCHHAAWLRGEGSPLA